MQQSVSKILIKIGFQRFWWINLIPAERMQHSLIYKMIQLYAVFILYSSDFLVTINFSYYLHILIIWTSVEPNGLSSKKILPIFWSLNDILILNNVTSAKKTGDDIFGGWDEMTSPSNLMIQTNSPKNQEVDKFKAVSLQNFVF